MFHELNHIQAVNEGKDYCGANGCRVRLDPNVLPDITTAQGRTWDISIFGIEGQWEVWAMYETLSTEPEETLYENIWYPIDPAKKGGSGFIPKDGTAVQKWIDKQLERSEIKLGVEVTTDDQFITLCTSGDNFVHNGHESKLYFFLRYLNPDPGKDLWETSD